MLAQTFIHVTLYLDQAFNPINDSASQINGNRGIYNTPILCEVLYILMEMSITATFTWIFLEGIYLNFLVSKYALQSSLDLKLYFIFGWGFPCILTFIWAIINWKYYKDEKIKTCWFGYNFTASYWCLQGPRLIIIIVNIVILCRVMRTVISKLRAHKTSEVVRIKKSVKAALLLLPLLGVTNLLSTFDIPITTTLWIFRIWCYTRQFFKSFQGFFLSVIYCFCNEEVRSVLRRRYNNSRRIGRFGRDRHSKENLKRSAARQDVDRPQQPTTSGDEPRNKAQGEPIERNRPNRRPTELSDTDSDIE
ncbi:unnamed protein product [Euphydryas editha]|uniref:G-protein coupled receptors family 2 profile 2 domain-containing protein n=1 Tax=Euphydryas editha TaxID=104508 RepID=A0AAU9UZA3_EUPED|nr:unnamed protein product [Euphydryas editha]